MILKNKVKDKIIFFFLVTLIAFSIILIPNNKSYASTKVLSDTIYYHLDMGVQLAYSGGNWADRGNNPGDDLTINNTIDFGTDIYLKDIYPFEEFSGNFIYDDPDLIYTENLKTGYTYKGNYKPYSTTMDVNESKSTASGSLVSWQYNTTLNSPEIFAVVDLVDSIGKDAAETRIYSLFGTKDKLKEENYTVYSAIASAIEQAADDTINLEDNELYIYFCPTVIEYQKYVEIPDETLLAGLTAPSSVEVEEEFTVADASIVPSEIKVDYAELYIKIDEGESELIDTWYGTGVRGENTGQNITQSFSNTGSIVYTIKVFDTDGNESDASKTVNVLAEVIQEATTAIADIELSPEIAYEGHNVKAMDYSTFTYETTSGDETETEYYNSSQAYSKGIARNSYTASGATTITKDEYDRVLTYDNEGTYNVTLKVTIRKGGSGSLYDSDSVIIRPTPYIEDNIFGFFKQNRKMTITAKIATHPKYPLEDYYIIITDLTTGEKARVDNTNTSFLGESIKTRELQVSKTDYFTDLSLEFLTKYPNYYETGENSRGFTYEIYAKDSKSESYSVVKNFDVAPDIPPQVGIETQDTYIREEGTNIAIIEAEDITTTDGDEEYRTWTSAGYNPSTDTLDNEYTNIKEKDGYEEIGFGTDQKITFNKDGVGKESIKLFVKDKWIEPTLEEFITENDYLTGAAIVITNIDNIAPVVSIEPIETVEGNVIIVGNSEDIAKAKIKENDLQIKLIQNGVDAQISYVNLPNTSNNTDFSYLYSDYEIPSESQVKEEIVLVDNNYFYLLSVKENSTRAAGSLSVYSAMNKNKIFTITIAEKSTEGAIINWNNIYNLKTSNSNICVYTDCKEQYIYVTNISENTTRIYKHNSGTYVGMVPYVVTSSPFISSDNTKIYNIGEDGITEINTKNLNIKKLTNNECYIFSDGYMKDSMSNGNAAFIMLDNTIRGSITPYKYYYCHLNLETEEIEAFIYPDISTNTTEPMYSDIGSYIYEDSAGVLGRIKPISMDSNGNAIFRYYTVNGNDDYAISATYYSNLKEKTVEKVHYVYTGDDYTLWSCMETLQNEDGTPIGYLSDFYRYAGGKHHVSNNYININIDGEEYSINSLTNSINYVANEPTITKIIEINSAPHIVVMDNYGSILIHKIDKINKKTIKSKVINGSTRTSLSVDMGNVFFKYDGIKISAINQPSNLNDRLEHQFKRLATIEPDKQTYVLSLGDNISNMDSVKSFIENNKAYSSSVTINNMAELLNELLKNDVNSRNALKISGTNSTNVARVLEKVSLEPNTKYSYSYDLVEKVANSRELLTIESNANAINLNETINSASKYKKILESIDFTYGKMPENTYAKYLNGCMLSPGYQYANIGLAGYGCDKEWWTKKGKGRSSSDGDYPEIAFHLDNAGYIDLRFSLFLDDLDEEVNIYVDGQVYEKYTISGNSDDWCYDSYKELGNNEGLWRGSYDNNGFGMTSRYILLPAGDHKIKIEVKRHDRDDDGVIVVVIHNVEIGEFTTSNNYISPTSNISNKTEVLQHVEGSFTTSNKVAYKQLGTKSLIYLTAEQACTKGYLSMVNGVYDTEKNRSNYDSANFWKAIGENITVDFHHTRTNKGYNKVDELVKLQITAPDDKALLLSIGGGWYGSGFLYLKPGETYYEKGDSARISYSAYSGIYPTPYILNMQNQNRGSTFCVWYYKSKADTEYKQTIFTGVRIIEIPVNTLAYNKDSQMVFDDYKTSLFENVYNNVNLNGEEFYAVRGIRSNAPSLERYSTNIDITAGDYIGFTTNSYNIEQYISNLEIKQLNSGDGIKRIIYKNDFNLQDKLETLDIVNATGNGQVYVETVTYQPEEEDDKGVVYKKGELIKYGISYSDYEDDPSKSNQGYSYWVYAHTPYNDGEQENAAIIYDEDGNIISICGQDTSAQSLTIDEALEMAVENGTMILSSYIPRFYTDGKYTVYHWEYDDTSRGIIANGYPNYDKASNIAEFTFYVEGTASAPWITGISTSPAKVTENNYFSINIGIDDLEKDILSLTTEVYKDKKLIYTHREKNIYPIDSNGNTTTDAAIAVGYPVINTGALPNKAGAGNYQVVCTIRDQTGVGIDSYKFTVISEGKITGYVNHTDKWDENRKKYNLSWFDDEINKAYLYADYLALSEPKKRGTNVFWSGEKFILRAAVAGSPTKVTCNINGTSYSTNMISSGTKNAEGEIIYTGSLWDKDMINKWGMKKPEQLTFTFTATYSAGTTKKHTASVIVDNMNPFWRLHRAF